MKNKNSNHRRFRHAPGFQNVALLPLVPYSHSFPDMFQISAVVSKKVCLVWILHLIPVISVSNTFKGSIQRCVLFSLFCHISANTFQCDLRGPTVSSNFKGHVGTVPLLFVTSQAQHFPKSLTSKGQMDFSLVLSTYHFFHHGRSDGYYWPFAVASNSWTFPSRSSSLNKLLIFGLWLRRNGHIRGCGIANTKHETSTVKKSQNHGNPPRTERGTEPFYVRNKQSPSGLTQGQQEEREKKNIPHVLPWNQTTTERTSFALAKFIARVPARAECFMTGAALLFIQVHSISLFRSAEKAPDLCRRLRLL